MRGKNVLVEWLQNAAVLGQRRHKGDQDMMPAHRAKFLRHGGYVKVLGKPDGRVLVLDTCEDSCEAGCENCDD